MEAKSILFSVAKGSDVLRVEEKRKGFSRAVLLDSRCAAWLLSMVEEMLRNPTLDAFVKAFRGDSTATFVRKGENKSGRFLEVAVYAVGGRRGLILLPEGRDGRGWSSVSGELSKVLAYFEAITVTAPADASPVCKFWGKSMGSPTFAEVVLSLVTNGGGDLIQTKEVAWCELEKMIPLGLEQETTRQAMDCSVFERPEFESSLVRRFNHGYGRRRSLGGGASWRKKRLEQIRSEVVWVILNGLGLKPKFSLGFRLRAGLKGRL